MACVEGMKSDMGVRRTPSGCPRIKGFCDRSRSAHRRMYEIQRMTTHRLDAACLYRLVLEKSSAGSRYHAVAEQGVQLRDIASVIGRRMNVPIVSMSAEEARIHFGWFVHFAAIDNPTSSTWTQQRLEWRPVQSALIPISIVHVISRHETANMSAFSDVV
jgi:hypothetical protein